VINYTYKYIYERSVDVNSIILLIIGISMIIIEVITGTFVLLWIGISLLFAAFLLLITHSYVVTAIGFICILILLLYSTQKFAKKIHGTVTLQNGVNALVGKEVQITSVSTGRLEGTCQIYGDVWSIRSKEPLTMNEMVIVERIEGATLYITHKGDGV